MAGANHYQYSSSKGVLTQKFEDDSLALNETCSDAKVYVYILVLRLLSYVSSRRKRRQNWKNIFAEEVVF